MKSPLVQDIELERTLPALTPESGPREVEYLCDLDADFWPEEGDGWNEPHYPAHVEPLMEIKSVKVTDKHGKRVYGPGFIGPLEPDVLRPGTWIEDLTGIEKETFADLACSSPRAPASFRPREYY
mgnify:CR=1 FL=1